MVPLRNCNRLQQLLHLASHHGPLPVTIHKLTSQAPAIVLSFGSMAQPRTPGLKCPRFLTPSNLSSLNPRESFKASPQFLHSLVQPRHPDILTPHRRHLLQPADE